MTNEKNIKIYVLIRSWKNFRLLKKSLDSALNQDYGNFKILYVDDASNYTKKQKWYILTKLKNHVSVFNRKRRYSPYNAYHIIHKYAKDNSAVVVNLDGDDWFYSTYALTSIANTYVKNPGCELTWGECLFFNGEKLSKPSRFVKRFVNIPYPKSVVKKRSYRSYYFLPLHPRSWKVSLFKSIPKSEFLDSHGNWLKFPEDMIMFFPMLEASRGRYKVIKKPLYVYNISNPLSDADKNRIELLKGELTVRRKKYIDKLIKPDSPIVHIHYNKLLSVPFIGNLIYLVQKLSLKMNLFNHIFLSLKYEKEAKSTLSSAIKRSSVIVFNTQRILHLLLPYNKNVFVYDNPNLNLKDMNLEQLYDLLWFFFRHVDYTTEKTKQVVKFLPDDYPIWRV